MAARENRHWVAATFLLCLTILVAGLAGCGDQMNNQLGGGNPSAAPSGPASSVGTGDTALTIEVNDGKGSVITWRLTCDPVGGDHPDPEAACQALAENGATALPAVPKDQVCTQQVGGSQSATVTGIWQGQELNTRFNLKNGCEIARWKALTGLLPAATG